MTEPTRYRARLRGGGETDAAIEGSAQVFRFRKGALDVAIGIRTLAEQVAIHCFVGAASVPFEILSAGVTVHGTTGADGAIHASIAAAERARLTIGAQVYTLHVPQVAA